MGVSRGSASDRQRRVAIALSIEEPYPQHQAVFQGIQRFAREHSHWVCEIDQHPAYQPQRRQYLRSYDGVIARSTPQLKRRLDKLGIPLVNTNFQQHLHGLPGVYRDPVATGRIAAEHLIERGFKRFAVYFHPESKHSQALADAYKQRLVEETFDCIEGHTIKGDAEDPRLWMQWEAHINDWVTSLKTPVGVFVGSEFDARMISQIGQRDGLHVPQDIAILCAKDQKNILEVSPGISSVQDNYERIGYEAAAMLDRLMDGQPAPEQALLIPPRGIMARESTDYYAVVDTLVADALRYFSANLERKISVDDIAYELAVSRRTLQIRFSHALGRSISDEMRRLRLSAIKARLADPELSIEQIASKTGFASAGALCHTFKRETGIAPSEFRKNLEGECRL